MPLPPEPGSGRGLYQGPLSLSSLFEVIHSKMIQHNSGPSHLLVPFANLNSEPLRPSPPLLTRPAQALRLGDQLLVYAMADGGKEQYQMELRSDFLHSLAEWKFSIRCLTQFPELLCLNPLISLQLSQLSPSPRSAHISSECLILFTTFHLKILPPRASPS